MKFLSGIELFKQTLVEQNGVKNNKSVEPKQTNIAGYETKQHKITEPNVTSSKKSSEAMYATLFNEFDLRAEPVFNFWTEDELFDETNKPYVDLNELPRFIKLTWKTAPLGRLHVDQEPTTKTHKRSINFGKKNKKWKNGLVFDTTKNFTRIKTMLGNGELSPGTIGAVVTKASSNEDENLIVDEQEYLTSESNIDLQDLQARNFIRNEGALQNSKSNNVKFFNNKMHVKLSENMTIQSSIGKDNSIKLKENNKMNVFFNDPAITGLVNAARVRKITSPEQANNILAISPYMQNLMAMSHIDDFIPKKKDLPGIPAVEEDVGVEYEGYVIEKYKQNIDGTFKLIEEIDINDPKIGEYIDVKVAYGTIYKYRMKSIVRWTRESKVNHNGTIFEKMLNERFSKTSAMATHQSSFFASEWSKQWENAIVLDMIPPVWPDEFTVMPQSFKKRVALSWKLPLNDQQDIQYYIIYRKIISTSGEGFGGWEKLNAVFGDVNALYYDYDVDFSQKNNLEYVYAVQTVSKHGEYSKLSEQLAVKLNADAGSIGEYPIRFVSQAGVDIDDIGIFSKLPIKDNKNQIFAKDKILLMLRENITKKPFLNKTYCIRIESTATAEKKDIYLNVTYDNVIPKLEVTKTENKEQKAQVIDQKKIEKFIKKTAFIDPRKVQDYARNVIRRNKYLKLNGLSTLSYKKS